MVLASMAIVLFLCAISTSNHLEIEPVWAVASMEKGFFFLVKGVSRFFCVHMFVCFGRGLIDSFVESCFPVSDASLYIRV